MRVIAFTGLPGSGKSVAVEAAHQRGIPVVRMGAFVLEEVARRGLPTDEAHIGPVASGMRDTHGPDVWAKRTIDALRQGEVDGIASGTDLVVVDGVRSLSEVARFRTDLGDRFTLVSVTAPEAVRHRRILGRGRVDDAAEHPLVVQRDAREKGWGVEEAMAQADHELHNDAGLDDFRHQVARLFDRLVADDETA